MKIRWKTSPIVSSHVTLLLALIIMILAPIRGVCNSHHSHGRSLMHTGTATGDCRTWTSGTPSVVKPILVLAEFTAAIIAQIY